MHSGFEGYGEVEQLDTTGWCPDHAICLDWIERRALQCIENFQDVDSVYMSEDVYQQFLKDMASKVVLSGPYPVPSQTPVIACVVTTAGNLTVKRVPNMCNFCYVGTSTSYKRLMQIQVDQAFEDIVMKDFDRV